MYSLEKKEIYTLCEQYVASKLEQLHLEIRKIKEALHSETKSTAGDKHETGRAMLQLEREKLGKQLLETEKMQQLLKRIPLETKSEVAVLGSLVKTTEADFYLSIPRGKVDVGNTTTFCISVNSPIGQVLLGKKVDDSFPFNGQLLTITHIE